MHQQQATADAMTLFTVTNALDPKNVTRVGTLDDAGSDRLCVGVGG
jgi:hypothetical protein